MVEFENNELHKALESASIWIAEMKRDVEIKDVVVHEIYADGFGAWVVKVYYDVKRA